MATLVINAPKWRSDSEDVRSFDQTFAMGIGQGYAIPSRIHEQCRSGSKIVLLCKDEAKRAEGVLVKLAPTEKAANGMQRYDVHMRDLVKVPYSPEALGRTGVAMISSER